MVQVRTVEITVGAFIAAGMVALFFLAMKVSNLSTFSGGDGYHVTARFENIGGLKVRSAVTVGGVKIGEVKEIYFDNLTFEAVVTLQINPVNNTLPEDTAASIYTAGLLGEQYVSLEPGGADAVLKEGSEIRLTQSALVLEQIVGQFLFSKAEEGVAP
jgi:phospholipid/cholesterol/gamma-HCH transport system substrate-binding protein